MVRYRKQVLLFFQQNCITITAIFMAVLLYSRLVPVANREPYLSLLSPEQVQALQCQVVSNPVKTGSGQFYRCTVKLQQVAGAVSSSGDRGEALATFQASGKVSVYIPSSIIEAHYPGKLYSAATGFSTGLIEQGAYVHLSGRTNSSQEGEPIFYATNCNVLGYPKNFWGRVQEFRGLCRLQFKRLMYGWGAAGGLLVALLCGSGEYTDSAVKDDFRSAGLAHVLALSGMHLSFFAGLASAAFQRSGRRLSTILSLLAIILFVWFAGFTPSLLRATICSLLGMATGLFGVRAPTIRILALCFFIHIAIIPTDIFQLSFQLSYLALAGILLLGPFFDPLTHSFLPAPVATSVSASVGAQIFSSPLTLFSLGTMMPGGIIASVVVSPLVSLFMTVGVVSIILSLLWAPLGEPLGHLVNLLYNCTIIPVKIFAKIPALELP